MENHLAILEKMEKQARLQTWLTGGLCVFCAVLLVCMLILTDSITGAIEEVISLAEPLQDVVTQVQDVAAQVNDMSGQAEVIMDNMESVTQALADADLSGMVENVNALTKESQNVVSEAMKKLDTIDINTLNKAIQDLADVVEPLAKVSNFFK